MVEHLEFGRLVAFHCAPAVLGVKPSNLIAHREESAFKVYRSLFNENGIVLEDLCQCKRHTLTLVYKPEILDAHLRDADVERYLEGLGYPVGEGTQKILKHLSARIRNSDAFPHEVGLFLGYPLEDVHGFVQHKGRNCKFCGYWMVYGDVDAAQKRFELYNTCRTVLLDQIGHGQSILNYFKGGTYGKNCSDLLEWNRQYRDNGQNNCRSLVG